MSTESTDSRPCWVPLESNPEVMTNFLHGLGLAPEFKVVDVFGFDDDLIAMLPQPVYALILLYPGNKVTISADGDNLGEPNKDVYFMKQTIRNACGTIALLHSVANVADKLSFTDDSVLKKFLEKTAEMSPEERGHEVENSKEISEVHSVVASCGQTEAPAADAVVSGHFVAFVERNGRLYELNGGKNGPVDHGSSSFETFAKDIAALCRNVISRTDEPAFSAVALVKE